MKRFIVSNIPTPGRPVELPKDEAHHAILVWRLAEGQEVELIDGQGHRVRAILSIRGKHAWVAFAEDLSRTATGEVQPVTLELAVLKGQAMEWAIEKAVELGVERLCPVLTSHTVVQTERKGTDVFRERWSRIADQALKQCGRAEKILIDPPVDLQNLLVAKLRDGESRFWCDEAAGEDTTPTPLLLSRLLDRTPGLSAARILIGPEGGWSDQERQMLMASACERVSLGPVVLRAETAALLAAGLVTSCFYRQNR